jgi:NADPH-dependent glutamate synthase beta subunit-like oxidoreductase
MTDRLGGMMVWGIPAFRLPVGIIEEDMQRILKHCPGIKVHLSTALGREVSLDELKARHDAVLLTIGAWWGKGTDIEGNEDPRVVDGVSFLRRVNAGERPTMPERVIVIGGGDVAMDACRVAKRLPGSKDVKVLYRRGPDEIPARKDELKGAIAEEIEFIYLTQPVAALVKGNSFALRCVNTRLGEPGADGRRQFETVPGSEHEYECGLVIMATGQKAASEELEQRGMMLSDRIRARFDGMTTDEAKVFAAGDGAFGGSTIVIAMMHGHRAAYYIKAHLEGRTDPLPYRTPFRTRRVPIAQDINWEVFPRQEQRFHGLGEKPVEFPEIESGYDEKTAKDEAARCYRCDAETGSSDYNVRTREDIFVMARTNPQDAVTQRAMLRKRLPPRENPFGTGYKATLEDIVFLPANLSRLVIDPYRDACNVATRIAGCIDLKGPFLLGGFDDAPSEVIEAIEAGARAAGSGYVGRRKPAPDVPWLQVAVVDEDRPDPAAKAVIYAARGGFRPFSPARAYKDQPLGIAVGRADLKAAIPFALDKGFQVLLLEASGPIIEPWTELKLVPDLAVIRDAIRIMRGMNREEDMDVLYFGGVRSGTDSAKLVGLGANAVVLGTSCAFALGGQVEFDRFAFYADLAPEERNERAAAFIKSLGAEASIMARCTGKTDVHNLEPEDLRSITIVTAKAAGIPLAGTHHHLSDE